MREKKHKHYWFYEHTIFAGQTQNKVGIVRFCSCGKKQMAFIKRWQNPPKDYDLSDIK